MLQNVPPIRLVALDLDGTLLNHEGKVTSRTRAALQAAADRGVAIVPTTGRPPGTAALHRGPPAQRRPFSRGA